MIVRELFAKLGFKVNDKGLKEFERGIGQAKSAMIGLGVVITAGAGAVLAMAHHTAEASESMDNLAKRTGVGAEEFQRMASAAASTGIGAEELANGLTILNRNLFMARKGGSEAAKAFASLGPSVLNAVKRGASAEEVFALTADAIARIDDPAKRAALSMAVLGRAGARMIPLLSKGSEGINELGNQAQELGVIFDHDAIKASEKFIKSFKTLKMIATGFKNIIGIGLIKAIQPFIDSLIDIRMEAARASAGKLKNFFVSIFKLSKGTASFLSNLFKGFNILLKPLGGVLGVLKGIVFAFTALKLLQLVTAFGSIAIAAYKLAAGLTFVGNSALIAQAKAAALPIMVGLAIAALLLLLEDVYVFMTGGGDSMIGLFAEKFPRAFGVLKNVILGVWQVVGPFFTAIGTLITDLIIGTTSWGKVFESIGNIIGEVILMITRLIGMTGQGIFGMLGRALDSDTLKSMAKAMGVVGTANMGNIGGLLGLSGSAGASQQNQVNQQITVNVGDRDDAATIGKKVGDASNSGLDYVFRSAGRSLSPGVAY